MNKMKRQLTLLILLTINLSVFGQHNFGLKTNGGLSKISNDLNSDFTTQNIHFSPSGGGGLFYNWKFGDKSALGVELLFIQIEGKERIETAATDPYGSPRGEIIIHNLWRHVSYIGVPIYYGLKLKKLTINFGFQTSFTLTSSGRIKGQSSYNGTIRTWDDNISELNIDSFDFGPRAGIIFNLTDKFAVDGTYYYGVNNILGNDIGLDWTWKVQQVTVGLRYTFLRLNL